MTRVSRMAPLAVALALITPAVAPAQDGLMFDAGLLRGSCSSETACSSAAGEIVQNLARSGVPATTLNESIGILAAVLIEMALNGTAGRRAVAAALETIAALSSDPAQSEGILAVAATVADADVALDALEMFSPVAASPS